MFAVGLGCAGGSESTMPAVSLAIGFRRGSMGISWAAFYLTNRFL